MKTGYDVHKNAMVTPELYTICVPMSEGITENYFISSLVFLSVQFSMKKI
jgi:hypothetical protein